MHVFSLTCAELAGEMHRHHGKGLYHAAALYREIFKHGRMAFADAPEFVRSPALARRLAEAVRLPSCRIAARQEQGDGVVKFAVGLGDGHVVESVLIPAQGRSTLCLSSQVGCRMGCRFCTTGAMGFRRNLTVEEIVWQVHAARFELGYQVHNIVFMGMGEPLDNFDAVIQAVRVMSDQRGLDIAHNHMTISTAGHGEGLRRLAALNLRRLRLAVSLNAADDALRSRLMPINRTTPLGQLKEELLAFPLGRGGAFFIEYVLLAGINDAREDARRLARYLEGLPARVNVIAYNRGASTPFESPPPEAVQRFCEWVAGEGVFVRLRRSRGQSIQAACGQLGASMAVA